MPESFGRPYLAVSASRYSLGVAPKKEVMNVTDDTRGPSSVVKKCRAALSPFAATKVTSPTTFAGRGGARCCHAAAAVATRVWYDATWTP